MLLKDLALWATGTAHGEASVTGVQVDSRLVSQGDLFVCLVGAHVDGHDYAQKAIDQGAVALLVDHRLDLDVAQIVVSDTLDGLRAIARGYRATLSAYFIAITGSNGKTSTKDILKSVLERVGKTVVTYKNQNTEIGTYLNLFRMDATTKYGVFEMGLDMPGDVKTMNDFLKADACLITSLSPTHIVNFTDIDHLAREKFAITDAIKDRSKIFFQADYEPYQRLNQGYHTFGSIEGVENLYSDVHSSNDGITFKVNGIEYSCNLLGEHQASNCAGVIVLMHSIGIDDGIIREGLNHVELTALRTQRVQKGESLVIMDAYKSNPDSARFALQLLKDYDYDGARVAVLSDMRELGNGSLQYHEDILKQIVALKLDRVYLYGPEFKRALNNIGNQGIFRHYDSFEALNDDVQKLFEEHQLILIKGSRYFALERLIGEH